MDADALTGLPGYAALPSALKESTSAIFLDIDGLRVVNYNLGHRTGDDMLKALSASLAREAEALHGQAFRVAGEEFILLLPGRTLDDAEAIANRLVSEPRDGFTISAVVFTADANLPGRLRDALEEFAETLYQLELVTGRTQSNVTR